MVRITIVSPFGLHNSTDQLTRTSEVAQLLTLLGLPRVTALYISYLYLLLFIISVLGRQSSFLVLNLVIVPK